MPSVVVETIKVNSRRAVGLNIAGVCCVPACCIGVTCLATAQIIAPIVEDYKDVCASYGGEANMHSIGERIRRQTTIFRAAVNQINKTCDPEIIDTNICLLDVISDMNPRTGQIINNSNYPGSRLLGIMKKKNDGYTNQIWNTYKEMGGDHQIVVYGLIEYLCQNFDPTSQYVMNLVQKFNRDSPLRTHCFDHKC